MVESCLETTDDMRSMISLFLGIKDANNLSKCIVLIDINIKVLLYQY